MLNLYTDLKIYAVITATIAVVCFPVKGIIEEDITTVLLCAVFGCLFGFIILFVFELIASARFNKLLRSTYEQCNLNGYIKQLFELTKKDKALRAPKILYINLAAGYIGLGQYETALRLLLNINMKLENKLQSIQTFAVYYNNLASAYINLGDFKNAAVSIDYMKQVIDSDKLKKYDDIRNSLFDRFQGIKMFYNINQGAFEGAEQFYLMELEKAKSLNAQVQERYFLAYVYVNTGRPELAAEHIEFIARYGGDTVYREKALKL